MGPFLRRGGALALIVFFIGAVAIWVWWSEGARGRLMAAEGIEVKATVTDLDERRTRRSSSGTANVDYYVSVSYVVGTTPHTARETVSGSFFRGLNRRDEITIRYLSDAPDKPEIEPGGVSSNALAAGIVGFCALLIASGILWLVIRHLGRMKHLVRNGTRLTGTITDMTRRNNALVFDIAYEDPSTGPQTFTLPTPGPRLIGDVGPGSAVALLIAAPGEKPVLEAVAKRDGGG